MHRLRSIVTCPVLPFRSRRGRVHGPTAVPGRFGRRGNTESAATHRAMERLDIGELARRDYFRLSGGQTPACVDRPCTFEEGAADRVDEPSASLDFSNRARLIPIIAALVHATEGTEISVVLSTHDPDHTLALSADILLLHWGTDLWSRHARDVPTAPALAPSTE